MYKQDFEKVNMAMSKTAAANTISTYELMGLRIQQILSSHTAQKTQCAVVSKEVNELDDDWNQLLCDISETDGVKVVLTKTGTARITWQSLDD